MLVRVGVFVGTGVRVGNGVDVEVLVGVSVGVIVGVWVGVEVGVATRFEIEPHPTNPGKSNKESKKMPALKKNFFRSIFVSFRGSLPPNAAGQPRPIVAKNARP